MEKLWRINDPTMNNFRCRRKLYCIRNLFMPQNATESFRGHFNKYWDEVNQQLAAIEANGKIMKIFCENIYMTGEEALDMLSKVNRRVVQIVRRKMDEGGTVLPLENKELLSNFLDWNNCLLVVRTNDAVERIQELFVDALRKRFHHFRSVVENNLGEGEVGLLIIMDEERDKIQFPRDIEFSLVTPPSYDDLLNSQRDMTNRKEFWRD